MLYRKHVLRKLIVRARVKRILSIRECCQIFKVSRSTVKRYSRRWRQMRSITHEYGSCGRLVKLTRVHLRYLRWLLKRKPELYLWEIQRRIHERFDLTISPSTLCSALKRMKFTRKKLWTRSVRYSKRAEFEYWVRLRRVAPRIRDLIWIDECHVDNRNFNRTHGRSKRGDRAKSDALYSKGSMLSVIVARDVNGVIAHRTLDGTVNSRCVTTFLKKCVFPQMTARSVVILDNASCHRSAHFRRVFKRHQRRCLYLSAYSPHLNPAELDFNCLKQFLKYNRYFSWHYTRKAILFIMNKLVNTKCHGYLNKIGYYHHLEY